MIIATTLTCHVSLVGGISFSQESGRRKNLASTSPLKVHILAHFCLAHFKTAFRFLQLPLSLYAQRAL